VSGIALGLGLGLGLQKSFRFSSQTARLIYRFSIDGTEYKLHLEKNFAATSGLNGLN